MAGLNPGARSLDAGGGPGAHAAVWAERGIDAYLLDPGAAMVTEAAGGGGVVAVRATSQQMPFRERTFAVVYFHLSIHYGDWRRSLDEAIRTLVADGEIWIWTLGPDHHRSSFLTKWFPRIETLDRARFPDPEDVAAYLNRYAAVEVGHETESKIRAAGEWASAVEAGFVSTLQLLSTAEMDAGLEAFAAANPDPTALVEYDLRWTWLHARR